MLNLTLPKKPHSRAKLAAYKRHWAAIERVQDEFNSQWIDQNLKDGKVADKAQLALGTVTRFRQWGRGQGKTTYSYFHGPAATTLFGIAEACGLELITRKRAPNGKT